MARTAILLGVLLWPWVHGMQMETGQVQERCRRFPVENVSGMCGIRLQRILDGYAARDGTVSFQCIYRSYLQNIPRQEIEELIEEQLHVATAGQLTLGTALMLAHRALLAEPGEEGPCREFLERVVFGVARGYREARLQLQLKSKKSGTQRRVAQPPGLTDFPEVFMYTLVREAFTCSAWLLGAADVHVLLDNARVYWPLLMSNYEAASRIQEWPQVPLATLGAVFDVTGAGEGTGVYGSRYVVPKGPGLLVQLQGGQALLPMFSQFDRGLGLPVWKLPVFLRGCSSATLVALLRLRQFELFPQEMRVLCDARGLAQMQADELLAQCAPFVLSLRVWAQWGEPGAGKLDAIAGAGWVDEYDDGVAEVPGLFDGNAADPEALNDPDLPVTLSAALAELVGVYDSAFLVAHVSDGARGADQCECELAVLQYAVHVELAVRLLYERVLVQLPMAGNRLVPELVALCCVLEQRALLVAAVRRAPRFQKQQRALWALLLDAPISPALCASFAELWPRITAPLPPGIVPHAHVHVRFGSALASNYALAAMSDAQRALRVADAFRGWARRARLHMRPLHGYFYLLLLHRRLLCANAIPYMHLLRETGGTVVASRWRVGMRTTCALHEDAHPRPPGQAHVDWVFRTVLREAAAELAITVVLVMSHALGDAVGPATPVPLAFAASYFGDIETQRVELMREAYSSWGRAPCDFVLTQSMCVHIMDGLVSAMGTTPDPAPSSPSFSATSLCDIVDLLFPPGQLPLPESLLSAAQLRAINAAAHDKNLQIRFSTNMLPHLSSVREFDAQAVAALNLRLDEGVFFCTLAVRRC